MQLTKENSKCRENKRNKKSKKKRKIKINLGTLKVYFIINYVYFIIFTGIKNLRVCVCVYAFI